MQLALSAENKKKLIFVLFLVAVFITRYKWSSSVGYAIFSIELVIVFFCLVTKKKHEFNNRGPFMVYTLFVAYEIINGISGMGLSSIKKDIYIDLGVCLLVYFLFDKTTLIKTLYFFRNMGFILSLLGCIEFAIKDSYFIRLISVRTRLMAIGNVGTSNFRVRTIFLQPMLCATMEVIFWFLIILLPYRKKIIEYVAMFVTLICLIGTQTRSSWIAFVVLNIVYLISLLSYKIRISRKQLVSLFAFLLLTIVVSAIYKNEIANILEIIGNRWKSGMNINGASYYNRFVQMKRAKMIWEQSDFLHKLFGRGNGYMLSYLYKHPIRGFFEAVDMQYAGILVDNGIIGLGLIFLIIIKTVFMFFKHNNRIIRLCCLCVLNILFSGLFYEIFGWISVMIAFCFCLRGLSFEYDENDG